MGQGRRDDPQLSTLPPRRTAPWRAIEARYWRPIESVTTLEALLHDDEFHRDPGHHVGLFSDHGVVHVRDVSARAHALAHQGNAVLFATRSAERVEFVATVAHALAYLHDIGMTPVNPFGRRVHAQFAAQTALSPGFDDVATSLLDDPGMAPLVERVHRLHAVHPFAAPLPLVVREVLATTLAHSKSAVAASVLEDRERFRSVLVASVTRSLSELANGNRHDEPLRDDDGERFVWMTDPHPEAVVFTDDVIDSIRVLRAADALRQRGTTLRTSSGFEIFADRETGHGVFALRSHDRRILTIVRDTNPISGAEANVAEAYLTADGVLRVALHRERFASAEVDRRVAEELAVMIADIAADAIGSFPMRDTDGTSPAIEVVRSDPSAALVADVVTRLRALVPRWSTRISLLDRPRLELPPDLHGPEVGEPYDPSPPELEHLFAALERHGWNVGPIDRTAAIAGVRHLRLHTGDPLLAPHTAASSVFVPLGPGLEVSSVGGYGDQTVPPWILVGLTGVVRDGERNSAVVAGQDVTVLVIPDSVFLRHWFHPYEVDDLVTASARWGE